MGVARAASKDGSLLLRVGVLTNVHDDEPQLMTQIRSRGELLRDWLKDAGKFSAEEYIRGIRLDHYEGFNLILFEIKGVDQDVRAWHVSNRGSDKAAALPALGGISNSEMKKPFAKVTDGQREFQKAITGSQSGDDGQVVESLMSVMR